jgi:2-phosphosulfolactate phosphatase
VNVEVYFSALGIPEDALKGRVVVVVDVLRACSTIVTALSNGARAIVPVADMAEASRMADALDEETTVLGGERGGKKIEGYDSGNSPTEYPPEKVAGKTVVLNTSNGTGAFVKARNAERAVAGCFLNADRVVAFLREALAGTPPDGPARAVIVCSGWLGDVGLEDVLCAGLFLDRLWGGHPPPEVSDGAHIALSQYQRDRDRLPRALVGCNHTRRLIALGHGADVAYCAQIDAVPVLPVYRDSQLTLEGEDRKAAAAVAAQVLAAAPLDDAA